MAKKSAPAKDPHRNPQTNVRLSAPARDALQALSERYGVSATAVVEMLLREKARADKLKIKGL